MGETPVKSAKKDRKKLQRPIRNGTVVYFLGFTKSKKKEPIYYFCEGVVVETPSPFGKAPHKVMVNKVAQSKFHQGGTEQDGRRLIGRTIHLQVDKLNLKIPSWLTPKSWWS